MDLHGSQESHETFISGTHAPWVVEPGSLTENFGQSLHEIALVSLLYVPDGHFSHAVPGSRSWSNSPGPHTGHSILPTYGSTGFASG